MSEGGLFDGGPPALVLCRHCGIQLIPLGHDSETWTDENGFTVCVKGPLEPLAVGVLHQPMPTGLRGSPGG